MLFKLIIMPSPRLWQAGQCKLDKMFRMHFYLSKTYFREFFKNRTFDGFDKYQIPCQMPICRIHRREEWRAVCTPPLLQHGGGLIVGKKHIIPKITENHLGGLKTTRMHTWFSGCWKQLVALASPHKSPRSSLVSFRLKMVFTTKYGWTHEKSPCILCYPRSSS